MWLDAVDDMVVCHQHIDHLPAPLVPDEHAATVAATQHPVVAKEISLLDLMEEKDWIILRLHLDHWHSVQATLKGSNWPLK